MKNRLIVSTCGTSLWTNQADETQRRLINRHTNVRTPADIPEADRAILMERIAKIRETMLAASVEDAGKLSAEIKGITPLYEGQFRGGGDQHILLCTETWLGEESAKLVEDWLKQQKCSVQRRPQPGLRTVRLDEFQMALSDLVQWCEATMPGYHAANYHIIFNLTGGFKSVQGFLQTLAMFYADEVVYIFESQKELLRIPRLPIRMAGEETVRAFLPLFRRLAANLPVQELGSVPETLVTQFESMTDLSPWGRLIWEQCRRAIYEERIWESFSPKLRYGENFEKSVRDLPADRRYYANCKIDQIIQRVEIGKEFHLKGLDFKELQGDPLPGITHEVDAWGDADTRRFFGYFDPDGVFVLDRLDKALHKG